LSAPLQVIIPSRALVELSRISADQQEPIEVALTENRNQILFRMANIDLVSQLIEGNFPDYDKIVPKGHTSRVVVNTRSMLNAVRIASFFARDAANVVRLDVEPGADSEAGTIKVSAQSAEVGGNDSEIEASIEGEPLEIAFNAKYLMDVLNVTGSDQVVMEFSTAASPGVFRPMDDVVFTHVIMPMHIPQG
jgi:DNA polymerase-3 subunit beta